MGVSNGSFEAPGTEPGRALDWSTDAIQAAELTAGFDGALPSGVVVSLGFESFEEWLGSYLFSWSDVTGEYAFSDADDFEEGWQNEPYFWGLPDVVVLAEFDSTPEPYEDFEEGWQNEPYYTSFASLPSTDQANFNIDDEAEWFEVGWRSNEFYMFDWSEIPSTVTASFDTTPEPYEDFEEDWPTEVASTL